MKIQKMELAQKINKIKSIVPKKPLQQVLQGILVKDGCFIANNLELLVKVKLEGIDEATEPFIIPAKAFDLIGNLPDGEVEIKPGKNAITIKAGKVRNAYKTLDPATFPLGAEEENGAGDITIENKKILKSMRRVSYAIPAQSTNKVMTALCLQASGGTLSFAGLDGHVLAWDRIDYDGEFNLLIPKQTIEKILSLGITEDILIKYNKTSAIFVAGEYEVHTRLIDGEYFKFQKMFNELPMHTVVDRNVFLEAMTRAKICTDEKSKVKLTMSGADLNISIKDDTADYEESISLQEEMTEQLIIAFNPALLIDTLKAFDCENVGLQLAGANKPMIVEAEDSDFKAVVLPVAI